MPCLYGSTQAEPEVLGGLSPGSYRRIWLGRWRGGHRRPIIPEVRAQIKVKHAPNSVDNVQNALNRPLLSEVPGTQTERQRCAISCAYVSLNVVLRLSCPTPSKSGTPPPPPNGAELRGGTGHSARRLSSPAKFASATSVQYSPTLKQ